MRVFVVTLTALGLAAGLLASCGEPARRSVAPTGYGQVDADRLAGIAAEPGAWLTGGRDGEQTYFSPLRQIDRNNVDQLGYAWSYDIDSEHGLEATPIVVDGVMYASGPTGTVYALDAASGRELWTFTPTVDTGFMRKACCGIVNRGVAVWKGLVFVASLDGYLYALDAASGQVSWSVDTLTDRERGYTITGAPYMAGDLVVIGNAGAEFDARGYVTAYDYRTGEQRWRFFTVPANPADGFEHPELAAAAATWDPDSLWEVGLGGTVWDGMAYDPELNLLYVGTGNAAPYARRLRSPAGGDNLYLASILAINPDSGRLVWHYQTTPADNWDFTATQKLILADLEIAGETRQVIMQAPKNGFFYVLDRKTGELLSAEPFATVTWASHVDPETGRPVETGQGEYFDAPKLVFPSPAGAHNWQPMSYSPQSGLVYIPTLESGAIWLMPDAPFEYQKGGLNMGSTYVFPMPGEWGLDGAVAQSLPPFEELAAGQPDTTIRGFLRAWDPVAQRLAWEVETSGQWVGYDFAFWNGGGVMSTASGLVFQGLGSGDLVVLDAAGGEELHRIEVGSSMMAAPMTYTVDGEQYVAIMAGLGGGGGQAHPPGSAAYRYGNRGRLVAFRLGGGPVPLRPEIARDTEGFDKPPLPNSGTAQQLELGQALYLRNCSKCHSSLDGRAAGIPDLRRMDEQTHREFRSIVLEGTRAAQGMGSFADLLSDSDVDALQAYLLDLAWKAYLDTQPAGAPHQPAAE
jgi:quinohemoprotein ethanol dehydrogenase